MLYPSLRLRYTYSMEQWRDQGFVLSARPHGEGGAVVSLLTENHGRHAGYLHGAMSSSKRAMIQPGIRVAIDWKSRVADQLGTLTLEQESGLPHGILDDPLKLSGLLSACALCDEALPEREGHPGLYHGFQTLIDMMEGDVWAAAYVFWEIAFLKELGFGLELTKCAGGGDSRTLAYVSPKSGRAVSYAAADPYKDKLLEMPSFLKPNGGPFDDEEIAKGLRMTGYFLEHWAFAHHTKGVPDPRLRFEGRYAKYVADSKGFDGQEDNSEKRRIEDR
jgi:DNA repair protein RecO (recombination protein O)